MKRNREEHVKWCKDRAHAQYKYDKSGQEFSRPDKAISNACASMISDMSKHDETKDLTSTLAPMTIFIDSKEKMESFIDGFN